MKYQTCSICDTAFEVVPGEHQPFTKEGIYVCEHCKRYAGTPRNMLPQQLRVIEPWQEGNAPCVGCGTTLWGMSFRLLADREVKTVDLDIQLKPGLEPLLTVECPNPGCPQGWLQRPYYLKDTPSFLRPPWVQYTPGIFPELDARPAVDRSSVEELREWHERWWSEWLKRKHPPAGKGVLPPTAKE